MGSVTGKVAAAAVVFSLASGSAMATQWNVSAWGKRRAFTEHIEKLAELVAEKTGGSFTLNISYGGLSTPKENLDGLSVGAFEMAQICAAYHPAKNPALTVLELPFLGVKDFATEIAVSKAVYAHPAVQKDMERWHATIIMPSPMPQYNIVGTGEAPKDLEGLKGLSVRAAGGMGKAFEALGAVPNSVPSDEVRQAMDSGVVSAVAFAPHAHMSFGTLEKAKWWTENLDPGTTNCPVVVNSEALAALNEQEREALLGSVDAALEHYVDYYENDTMKKWGPLLEEKGIGRVSFDDAALAAFREKVAGTIMSDWVKEQSAGGLPAEELLKLVQDTVAGR